VAGSKRAARDKSGNTVDGVWELRVTLGKNPATGKRRQLSRTFHGGARAADKELARLVAQGEQEVGATASGSVGELVRRYIDNRKRSLSPATISVYSSSASKLESTALWQVKAGKATAFDIDQALGVLVDAGASPYVTSQGYRLLKSAFNQGIAWGILGSNPCRLAQAPRVPRKRVEAPAPEDVRAMLEEMARDRIVNGHVIHDKELAAALLFAASTGLRRGALCGLKWGDLERDRLMIRRTLIVVDEKVVERPPKMRTKGEVESVALVPAELALLKGIRTEQNENRKLAGLKPVGSDGWVLSGDRLGGSPRRPRAVALAMRRACVRAGVPPISPHDLRHFAATQMLAAGASIDVVARRLHHRNAALTLAVYAHPSEEDERRAGDAVASILA
jgi:integrase